MRRKGLRQKSDAINTHSGSPVTLDMDLQSGEPCSVGVRFCGFFENVLIKADTELIITSKPIFIHCAELNSLVVAKLAV